MVYDSEDAAEAQLSGPGTCIHHWAPRSMTSKPPPKASRSLGGEVMSPLDAGVVKFRHRMERWPNWCRKTIPEPEEISRRRLRPFYHPTA